jgi:hypothetical protein
MSVRPGLKRSQGKGDAWRVSLSVFQKNFPARKQGKNNPNGTVTHTKNGFTRTTYK